MPNLKDYDQEKALIVGVRRQYEEEKNIKENYKMPYPRYGGGPPQDNRNQGQNVSLPTNLF